MTSLFLADDDTHAQYLQRVHLTAGISETWLQKILFTYPRLVPLDQIEHGAGEIIPLCRELPLPKAGGQVFLDLLGITRHGRLVLIECKLWRNPQARREVVAQIIEYAALLRRWSYSDLTARLKSRLDLNGQNPIYDHASEYLQGLSEADFTDAVSRNLRNGDFHLIIAGDGIRDDMSAIAEHLSGQGARLALVEFQVWQAPNGPKLLVPHIPFKTEVLRQRIITDMDGSPVLLEEESAEDPGFQGEPVGVEDRAARRIANREFWQRYIDHAVFDHPDQPSPRHGGNNWVKIPLPLPGKFLSAYRVNDTINFSLSVHDPEVIIPILTNDANNLRDETGLPDMRFHSHNAPEHLENIGLTRSQSDFANEDVQIAWLVDVGNRLVNAFRPRLTEIASTMQH